MIRAEVYDDGAFYHSLLKELLDDGGNNGSSSAAANGAVNGLPKLKRVKKPTNNRQSKGRRLSYEVQPKLMNFMFPEIPERPVVLAELFAAVFGQRTGSTTAAAAQYTEGAEEQEGGTGSSKAKKSSKANISEGEIGVRAGTLFG